MVKEELDLKMLIYALYELVHLVAKSKQSQLFETTKGRTLQCGGI